MNCTNCGRWNPEDKTVCWHCQMPLPKPQPKKQKRPAFMGLPTWMWVALVLFFVVTTFGQCMMMPPPA